MKRRILSLVIAVALLLAAMPHLRTEVAASNTYSINGVSVSWDDYSPSAPSDCWNYANKFYKKIWGVNFTNSFDDINNSLRNLSDAELTLTEAHLKKYVSNAALGSCLRICNSDYLHGRDTVGHSQIIVQKDANGFTVFEGGLSAYPYCREQYFTWSDYINRGYLGGKYSYIKYIKWPGAPAYSANIMATFDINGYLDGVDAGNLSNYGTFDVWVNGSLVADNVIDYCADLAVGSRYEITDIQATSIHKYLGRVRAL